MFNYGFIRSSYITSYNIFIIASPMDSNFKILFHFPHNKFFIKEIIKDKYAFYIGEQHK